MSSKIGDSVKLTTQCLKSEMENCLLDYNSASTIPPRLYSEPSVFDLEKERMLTRSWVSVGHVSEIANSGDYFTVDFCEEPILVIRDKNNEVHALSNVCVHRNFPVAHGKGNCNLLKCQYHRWMYNLDGTLRGAPLMENAKNFSIKDWRLHSFHLEIWQGWIFVNLSTNDIPALAPQIREIEPVFSRHDSEHMVYLNIGKYDIQANWKGVVDIFAENYHTSGIHEKSLNGAVPSSETIVDSTNSSSYCMFRLPSGIDASLENPEDYLLTGGFELPKNLQKSDLEQAIGGIVFPTFSWYFNPDLIFYVEINPQTYNSTSGRYGIGVSKDATEAPDFKDKYEAYKKNAQIVVDEDIWGIEQMSRGKRSAFAVQGRTSQTEASLWHFHKWYVEYSLNPATRFT